MKTENPYAVVVGLDSMTGLQTARLLARRQVPVIAIAKDSRHPCCRTQVCRKIIEADTTSEDVIRTLETLGPELDPMAVLYPCNDNSVLLVSRHRERLARWYRFGLPEPEVVEMLMDKGSFYTYAKSARLPIPGTFFLRDRADAEEAARQLSFPCILKPSLKSRAWQTHTRAKVFRTADADELLRLYDQCSGWADMLMAQEWIDGPDSTLYSCNCYFNADSEPLVTFIARKLRQWPPRIGTSCLGEECRNDTVLDESLRLLRAVRYRGLGYVEMKLDERTGRHYIIEVNVGRPTGRSAIAEAGGVELLYTMYRDLLGRPLPENRKQSYRGVKWIYLRHDIQSALHYWWRGQLSLREWWRSIRGRKVDAIFSWNDPWPFVHDLLKGVGVLVGRRR